MQKMLKLEIPAEEAAQVQAEIEHLLGEMRASQERMQKDQEEIERLKKRTRANLSEIDQLLSRKVV
jgi:hypothetical protein